MTLGILRFCGLFLITLLIALMTIICTFSAAALVFLNCMAHKVSKT